MDTLTRRAFLGKACVLTAGGIVADGIPDAALAAAASEPNISFPTEPRARIAIASYPFRAYINSPSSPGRDEHPAKMELLDFPAHVVAKFGIHNIEPLGQQFLSLQPQYLESFRKRLERANVRVVNIPASVHHSFYDAAVASREMAVENAKKWVDAAVHLGSPGIRTHVARAKNSKPDVQRAAETLSKVADYAAGKNIVVTLENDDLVSEDAFFLVKVIEAVKNPYLRALPDFANSMLTGDADFNYRALTEMFQHAYNICHIKDGEAGDNGKQFDVDLKKSFDILKASGYRGYCSMEYDAPGDPYAPTAKLIEQTLTYLS
ncbi:MAG TPA: sugar phosphate isomerase/epimerase family protein [Candidatus Methylomirabilis sp.]|nr:sugar phosphate isomerase/epimerase family protein [Candidatus Methylomirabilis sp.]